MHLFNLDLYKPTEMELWISKKYKENGINTPFDMDLDFIASLFNTYIVYDARGTKVIFDDEGDCLMFLNIHGNKIDQRLEFFHELCHPAMHVGNQRDLPSSFVSLQETQASLFQMYAAMPAYMLEQFKPSHYQSNYVRDLSEVFNLPHDFVKRRIDQIYRRISQERYDRNVQARTTPRPTLYSYTDTTMKILNQLNRQLAERKG